MFYKCQNCLGGELLKYVAGKQIVQQNRTSPGEEECRMSEDVKWSDRNFGHEIEESVDEEE